MSIYYSLLTAVFALLFAMAMFSFVAKSPAGNERMREISASIHEGAQAFLFAEYRVLVVFVLVLFVAIGIGLGNWITAVCFLCGAVFSVLAGYFGMDVATKANVRTAEAVSYTHLQ